MIWRRSLVLFLAFALVGGLALFPSQARAFETGGDMSELTWEQSSDGVTFRDPNGNAIDPIAYAKSEHWTCIRLRLLVDGGSGVLAQNMNYDIALAKRIKSNGLHLILDIFYSNGWCDPGEQPTPSEWASQSYTQLKATVQSYTANVITTFKNNGCLPDYVQIGNEINNGMLWPVGSLSNQSQFVGLIQAGIAGVRQVSSIPKIILHCANAANTSLVEWFFNTIASQCSYDVVGLSYYPSQGTNLSDIKSAMTTYKGMFGNRPIMLVEFAYWYSGSVTSGSGYWTTPAGQQQITWDLVQAMKGYPQGDGVIWWGTTYVTGSWGAESLFDFSSDKAEPAWGSLWQ
ncbi:MAG TPA: glycosyl hydrolase 53 family protein [Capsulimonadaceae bacterium]|nr:glycosyl hydrolase 53 family protein [Capsulimonadaceae bacterium]